jgi:hypothetical protein
MREDRDAMMLVRAELCERLALLQSYSRRTAARNAAETLTGIRTLAAAYGLLPVVRLVEALENALAAAPAHHAQTLSALYLDRMQDAIGCSRFDEQASQTLMASVSVRLGA